ncbi:CSC1-like protein At3g54510, partial [Citrus sinensis]|uniref:CSC1-like protein At3g54510 n=1 Tax=Citrus sinensis TaxID=2711 RepID=UPI0007637256
TRENEPRRVLASAVINIALALIILTLFSILKKQPSVAPIYYARRLSSIIQQNDRNSIPLLSFDHHHSFTRTLSRILPSFSWIPRAFRVTEEEILQTSGLDALIVIRLFKFGINFFIVCSLIGFLIILPINYCSEDAPGRSPRSDHFLDSFSISNIGNDSNRLWVHFTCLWVISFYGLYLLYKEYNEILIKRIQRLQSTRHRPDQFTVLVHQIPFCEEHGAHGCSVEHFFSKHHPHIYYSYQMLYTGKDLQDLLNQSRYMTRKIEDLREKTKKHYREPLLLEAMREDIEDIALHKEKFQELYQKMHQLQGDNMLKDMELPVAFVTFKSRWDAALAAQSQQHLHPLRSITERAPEPRDVYWRNLAISYKIMPFYKIGVIFAASLLTIFFTVPVTAVQGIARFEKLKKWFPPAMAIELIPGLSSVLTGYLPSVILNGFIYIVPFAMLGIAKLGGSISNSKVEIKSCNMVFYFLVGNVFFLSLISGSLLDKIGESVTHPRDFPSHLARAVSAQADFLTYTLVGFSGFCLEAVQAAGRHAITGLHKITNMRRCSVAASISRWLLLSGLCRIHQPDSRCI